MLFELIKGLIKDLDGTSVDEVHIRNCYYDRNIVFAVHNFNIDSSTIFPSHDNLCNFIVPFLFLIPRCLTQY